MDSVCIELIVIVDHRWHRRLRVDLLHDVRPWDVTASRSGVGSPRTSSMSARYPGAIRPRSVRRNASAVRDVAADGWNRLCSS